MNIEELWQKALNETVIIKSKLSKLSSFYDTEIPYIFIAESQVNPGSTVVRKGKVVVSKPIIFLPENTPQFYGFQFEEEMNIKTDTVRNFFLLRGISFPSLKYSNSSSLEVLESNFEDVMKKYQDSLEKSEDTETGLIVGSAENWQFSILIYIANLIIKSVPDDIIRTIKKFKDTLENN